MKIAFQRLVIAAVAACAVLFFVSPAIGSGKSGLPAAPTSSGQSGGMDMDIEAFGRLPVLYNGRVMPFSALSQIFLRALSGRSDVAGDHPISATVWFLDVVSGVERERTHKVIRIVDHQIIELLGLKPEKGYRYSIGEIMPAFHKIADAASGAEERARNNERLDVFDSNLVDLFRKIRMYSVVKESFALPHADSVEALDQAERDYSYLSRHVVPLAIAPVAGGEWKSVVGAWLEKLRASMTGKGETNPAIHPMVAILYSYYHGDSGQFNTAVREYTRLLRGSGVPDLDSFRLGAEDMFVKISPVYRCSVLYLVSFLLCLCWSLFNRGFFIRAAQATVVAALIAHTAAIIARIYISGRPPVTNLYSSALFIGWGIVLAGLIADRLHAGHYGLIVGSIGGFVTQLIAYYLSLEGDTFMVLQAVLDTNFWLATHVVAVTLGYTATFFAGLLGIIYIAELFLKKLDSVKAQGLSSMLYGTICFAVFFSFVGTVLGGLWADDSWGRFWGWDPKENGALLIVLWNALMLHAKWGGMVGGRGLATMAVFGNVVTAWSWFGTNMLGIGLHSYGQQGAAVIWLIVFVISQVAIIAASVLMPHRLNSLES